MKVGIVGASGKFGIYMLQHALDRGYEVVGVCRERSVGKLDAFKGRITVIPGATNDELIHKAPAIVGCRTPSALAHAADAGPGSVSR